MHQNRLWNIFVQDKVHISDSASKLSHLKCHKCHTHGPIKIFYFNLVYNNSCSCLQVRWVESECNAVLLFKDFRWLSLYQFHYQREMKFYLPAFLGLRNIFCIKCLNLNMFYGSERSSRSANVCPVSQITASFRTRPPQKLPDYPLLIAQVCPELLIFIVQSQIHLIIIIYTNNYVCLSVIPLPLKGPEEGQKEGR